MGQFLTYRLVLKREHPERTLGYYTMDKVALYREYVQAVMMRYAGFVGFVK